MDNDELLIKIKDIFDTKVDEVKVLVENLESKIQIVAEGHDILNRKIDAVDKKVDAVDKKVDAVDRKVDAVDRKVDAVDRKVDAVDRKVNDIKKDMAVVKDYVIGVDAKLNEHEIILKRVK